MNVKQTLKKYILPIILIAVMSLAIMPSAAMADDCPSSNDGTVATEACNNGCGTTTAVIQCKNVSVTTPGAQNTGIWSLLLTAINIMTAGVGVAAVGGLVYASILYTTAQGNADQTKKAIEFIRNIIIGIVMFALMFSFLNFIIPGGLFDS